MWLLRDTKFYFECWKIYQQEAACKESTTSDSAGLVDFVIRLANSVSDLPDGQVISFEEFE